jgi:hypothetical protein
MCEARLVKNGSIIENRQIDRVPIKGEYVWRDDDRELFVVAEVFWRTDGKASILLKDIE